MFKLALKTIIPITFFLSSSNLLAEEVPINSNNLIGEWNCSFTMEGNKVYKEKWYISEKNKFNVSGEVDYFLKEKNAHFTYSAIGEWKLINGSLKLVYKPFDFKSDDEYSSKYISDIEGVYITPAWNGTRRFEYYIEELSKSQMQIGDDYDSWKCVKNN